MLLGYLARVIESMGTATSERNGNRNGKGNGNANKNWVTVEKSNPVGKDNTLQCTIWVSAKKRSWRRCLWRSGAVGAVGAGRAAITYALAFLLQGLQTKMYPFSWGYRRAAGRTFCKRRTRVEKSASHQLGVCRSSSHSSQIASILEPVGTVGGALYLPLLLSYLPYQNRF